MYSFLFETDEVKPKITLRMSVPLFTSVGRTDITGRLLTPEEGCGYSAKRIPRAVKNGAWPWSALIGQKAIGMNLGYRSSKYKKSFISTLNHLIGTIVIFLLFH